MTGRPIRPPIGQPDSGRSTIRVAIVDDHDVVHAGIEAWCRSAEPPIELAGSYTDPD